MTAPIPGWYADPAGSGSLRWWDGAAWTHDTVAHPDSEPTASTDEPTAPVHEAIAVVAEPVATEPVATEPVAAEPIAVEPAQAPASAVDSSAAVAAAADWYPDPQNPTAWRWWDGTAWTEHVHAPEVAEPAAAAVAAVAAVAAESLSETAPAVDPGAGEVAAGEPVATGPEATAQAEAPNTVAPITAALAAGALVTVGTPLDHDEVTGEIPMITSAAVPTAPVAMPVAAGTPVTPGDPASSALEPGDVLPDVPHGVDRRLIWVGVAVAALLVIGVVAWLALHFLHQSQLSQPASSTAEQAWSSAGSSLGSQSITQGIADSDIASYCAGGFDNINSVPLPPTLQGVALDRAKAIYVDACEKAHTSGGSAPTTTSSSASPTSSAAS